LFAAAHQAFGQGLIDSLPKNLGNSVAIRTEENGFAVGSPGEGKVLVFVEREPAVREEAGAVRR